MDPVIACVDISMKNTAITWFRPSADRGGGWEPFRWKLLQPKLKKEHDKLKKPQKEVELCRQMTRMVHDALPGTISIAVELYTGASQSVSGTKSLAQATCILAGYEELHPEADVIWIPQGKRLVLAFGDPRKSELKVTKERIMRHAHEMYPKFFEENKKSFASKTAMSGYTAKFEHVADTCLLMAVVLETPALLKKMKSQITDTQDATDTKTRARPKIRRAPHKGDAGTGGKPGRRLIRRR